MESDLSINVAVNGYDKNCFLVTPHYKKHIERVLIPHGMICDRIEKLAHDICQFYKNKEINIICILKGSRNFFSCLLNALNKINLYNRVNDQAQVIYFEHYVRLKSYNNASSTGKVSVMESTLSNLKGKDILIVEDIIDTGLTITEFTQWLTKTVQPCHIAVTTLLQKCAPKPYTVHADFVGFTIPDVFVIGFGLDYNEYFRDLKHICIVNQETLKDMCQ